MSETIIIMPYRLFFKREVECIKKSKSKRTKVHDTGSHMSRGTFWLYGGSKDIDEFEIIVS